MPKLERELLQKLAGMTGARAMIEAKAFGTYIVYGDEEGKIVYEYPDGRIVIRDEN